MCVVRGLFDVADVRAWVEAKETAVPMSAKERKSARERLYSARRKDAPRVYPEGKVKI